MRLSTVFQVSFVGALMFSPAMAEDLDQVHEQALKVLRGQATNAPARPPAAPATTAPATVGDRDAQRRQQAADAEIRRQQQQDQRRRQFEQEVQQREMLRQQQRQYDENVARQVGIRQPSGQSPDEMHSKALEILRNGQSTTAATTAAPALAQPIVQPTPAPAPVQAAPPTQTPPPTATPAPSQDIQERAREILKQQQAEMQKTPSSVQFANPGQARSLTAEPTVDEEAMHQRALEILRGGQPQSQPTTVTITPNPTPAPSQPATVQRTQPTPAPQPSIQPQPVPTTVTTTSPATETANPDVHSRALDILHQQSNPSTQPAITQGTGLDPRTQEMIRRQNQELSRQVGTTASSLPPASTATVASRPPENLQEHELTPEMESRAREILRQQSTASVQPVPAVTQPAPSTVSPTTNSDVQYSKELEARARQQLLDRAQANQTVQPSNTTPAQSSTIPPANNTSTTAANPPSDADIAAIHAKALDVMEHSEGQSAAETTKLILSAQKPKREKIQELTELYKADKLTPAQYHEARAKILAQPQ